VTSLNSSALQKQGQHRQQQQQQQQQLAQQQMGMQPGMQGEAGSMHISRKQLLQLALAVSF
jgi:hypothetical protein